jgi:hypothetical protein
MVVLDFSDLQPAANAAHAKTAVRRKRLLESWGHSAGSGFGIVAGFI